VWGHDGHRKLFEHHSLIWRSEPFVEALKP